MKKPLRKRIADAIKILKGEPLPIDLAPMPKITTTPCNVMTLKAYGIYGEQYHHGIIPREELRKRAEKKLADELGQAMLRAGVIQFQEDAYEPALHAKIRVLVPEEGELAWAKL